MPTTELVVSIVVAVLGSTGLFTFIQYLLTRKANKDQKLDELQRSINDVKKDISDVRKEIDEMRQSSNSNFDLVNDNIHRSNAVQARIRILRANDELRQDVRHSYEYFRQLHQDITDYENYCLVHPDFKNNEAVTSIEYINKTYLECLENNTFLT